MDKRLGLTSRRYKASVDIRLAASVGRALPSVIRGETTMLEHMRPNGMLDEFYGDSLGLPASNRWLGRMVKQLAHRHPRMNFLEIGESHHIIFYAIFIRRSSSADIIYYRCWHRVFNSGCP